MQKLYIDILPREKMCLSVMQRGIFKDDSVIISQKTRSNRRPLHDVPRKQVSTNLKSIDSREIVHSQYYDRVF